MRQWHVEHMEKTVVKYVGGLAENATTWERKQHKRYGNLANICKQIDYDLKHGVTEEQLLLYLKGIRSNSTFAKVRKNAGAVERLDEVEGHYRRANALAAQAAAQPRHRLYYSKQY